jgi:hypothetical protein
VLVGEPGLVEVGLELGVEDLLEEVLELAVVRLEDGVLGAHVHRVVAHETVTERRTGEIPDGVVEVVHAHADTAVLAELGDLELDGLAAVLGRVGHGDGARAGHLEVGRLVLVPVRMTADHDGLRPSRHEARDVRADDGLAEDHATQDVADRAVRRLPHLLQLELLDPGLVGGDGGTLHTDTVLEDRVGRIDGHLVIGGIAVLHPEVVVLEVHVEIRQDQAVLDELPDDAGHLVAVEFDDRIVNLDLCHGVRLSESLISLVSDLYTIA